jgi:hypothetical protein
MNHFLGLFEINGMRLADAAVAGVLEPFHRRGQRPSTFRAGSVVFVHTSSNGFTDPCERISFAEDFHGSLLIKGPIEREGRGGDAHDAVASCPGGSAGRLLRALGNRGFRHDHEDLRGCSVAFWSRDPGAFHLSRTGFDACPLYYLVAGPLIGFSTSLELLLSLKLVPLQLSVGSYRVYMASGCTTGRWTLFDSIYQVPPGHVLFSHGGQCHLRAHASPLEMAGLTYTHRTSTESFDSARALSHVIGSGASDASRFALLFSSGGAFDLIKASVRDRGATDVVCRVQYAKEGEGEPDRAAPRPVNVNGELVVPISVDRFLGVLIGLSKRCPIPVRHPSLVSLRTVCEHLDPQVTLAIEDGVELLSEDRRFFRKLHRIERMNRVLGAAIPRAIWTRLRSLSWSALDSKHGGRLVRLLPGPVKRLWFELVPCLGLPTEEFLAEYHATVTRPVASRLLSRAHPSAGNLGYLDARAATDGVDDVARLMQTHVLTRLCSGIEHYRRVLGDAGVRGCFPFIEVAKEILRLDEAAHGFGFLRHVRPHSVSSVLMPPLQEWLRQPRMSDFVSDHLLDRTARERGLFNSKAVENYIKHLQGAVFGNHAAAVMPLWMLLTFELWHRYFLDDAAQSEPVSFRDTDPRAAGTAIQSPSRI